MELNDVKMVFLLLSGNLCFLPRNLLRTFFFVSNVRFTFTIYFCIAH